MTKRILQSLLFTFTSITCAMAQIDCSNSTKLVCQIPFSTGVFTNNGSAQSQKQAQNVATGFNSAIATQVSQLPLASASSGTVVVYKAGVPQTYSNLGPILTDRAETVGKHNLFLAFTASQFFFTDIDGITLRNVPFSYQATGTDRNGNVVSTTYITQDLNIHFRLDQYTAIGTYGLTNNLDFSIILPIERVSVGAATLNTQTFLVDTSNDLLLH